MSAKAEIFQLFEQVAAEQGKRLTPLQDDLGLLDCGLDSLCLAIIVARLEDRLGVDPFNDDEEVSFPTTMGQFVSLYESRMPNVGR